MEASSEAGREAENRFGQLLLMCAGSGSLSLLERNGREMEFAVHSTRKSNVPAREVAVWPLSSCVKLPFFSGDLLPSTKTVLSPRCMIFLCALLMLSLLVSPPISARVGQGSAAGTVVDKEKTEKRNLQNGSKTTANTTTKKQIFFNLLCSQIL